MGLFEIIEGIRQMIQKYAKFPKPGRAYLYFYRVVISGVVIEPKEVSTGKGSDATRINFELAFEDPPFFRSFEDSEDKVFRKYRKDFEDLVKAMEIFSIRCRYDRIVRGGRKTIGAFNWKVYVPINKVSKSYLDLIKKLDLSEEDRRMLAQGYVFVPLKPEFSIRDISIEKAMERKVVPAYLSKAKDVFVFRLFRAGDIDPYFEYRDEFVHSL